MAINIPTDPDADPEHWYKIQKDFTKQKKSRFFFLFLLDDGRIRSRSWSLIRTCDYRIRMRIREA
jgi:hypothetical protein